MDFKGLLWEGIDWIHLAYNKGQRWTLVDKDKNSSYIKCRELLNYHFRQSHIGQVYCNIPWYTNKSPSDSFRRYVYWYIV